MIHSPFAYNWRNRFWDSEPVVAHFLSNNENSAIQIPRNSSELHPALCMCDMCRVRGLGPSCTLKQNVLSLIFFDSVSEAHESKVGHL